MARPARPDTMRTALSKLLHLRRHPQPQVRLSFWVGLVLLALLGGILVRQLGGLAMGLVLGAWGLFNTGLAGIAMVWGLLHPRAVLAAWQMVLRWALWIALLLGIWVPSRAAQELTRSIGMSFSSSAVFMMSAFLFAGFFVVAMLAGLVLASAGAWSCRNLPTASPRATTAAVVCAWAGLMAGGVVQLVLPQATGPLGALFILGTPFWAALGAQLSARDRLGPFQSLDTLAEWAEARLVVGRRPWDLRGPVLGLVAVLPVFALAYAQFFLPLQAAALVGMIRVRNQPLVTREEVVSFSTLEGTALGKAEDRLVLTRWDALATRRLFSGASEAAIQAELIRRLKGWGAAQVVLPAPQVEMGNPILTDPSSNQPPLTEAEVKRNQRDLARLVAAVREAGNVVVSLPDPLDGMEEATLSMSNGRARLRREDGPIPALGVEPAYPPLIAAAKASGSEAMGSFALGQLPTLRLATGRAPEPVSLVTAQLMEPVLVPRAAVFDGSLPLTLGAGMAGRGRKREVLVDIRTSEPGSGFTTVDYSSMLDGKAGQPVFVKQREASLGEEQRAEGEAQERPRGAWQSPAQFFKGKTVFLERPSPFRRETPIGTMPRTEAMAHATAMFLSNATISLVPAPLLLAGIAALGALVGLLCNRRGPTEALVRAGFLAGVVALASPLSLAFGKTWLDPVLLLVAIGTALAVVGQVTYAAARRERQRIGSIMERYLPPALLDRFMAENRHPERALALQGDRRSVCVLFADTRNFTRFSEMHPPEEVVNTTNRYLTVMAEALFEHGGILDKFTGDGLMAFFLVDRSMDGAAADVTREEVVRAVNAALAMRDAAIRVSAELVQEGKEALQIGLGVHYGPAVVGLVGSPKRPDYTALGHAVVVSHRLQGLAAGGEIVISETVANSTFGAFETLKGDPVQVKGITEPVVPYRVLSALPAPPV